MKRRALLLLLLLVAGAIVNVAVAWGCVVWVSRDSATTLPSEESVRYWREYWSENEVIRRLDLTVTDNPRETFQRRQGRSFRYALPSALLLHGLGIEQSTHRCMIVDGDQRYWFGTGFEVRAGWPTACLTGRAVRDRSLSAEWKRSAGVGIPPAGSEWLETGKGWRDLPIKPIWPGFAINTVFYAGVLWLLFAFGGTPLALRRRRRTKRGLCPKCAYDLRGAGSDSATCCPECGATVNRIAR